MRLLAFLHTCAPASCRPQRVFSDLANDSQYSRIFEGVRNGEYSPLGDPVRGIGLLVLKMARFKTLARRKFIDPGLLRLGACASLSATGGLTLY